MLPFLDKVTVATWRALGGEGKTTHVVPAPVFLDATESEGGGKDAGLGGSWAIFVNPSTGVVLRLPAHDEAEAAERWCGPGAWTSDDEELDGEALDIIAGPDWVTFRNPDTGVVLRLPAHDEAEAAERWRGPGAWTSDDEELDDEASHGGRWMTFRNPDTGVVMCLIANDEAERWRDLGAWTSDDKELDDESGRRCSWVTFRNPDTGVVLNLPAHDEADSAERWSGPGAWTSDDEELDGDASRGGSWVIFVNPSTGVVLRLPEHDEVEAAERWCGPGVWTSDDEK